MMDQPIMARRVAAAQATLDRFKDLPYRFGVRDCVRMTAWHLKRLGYTIPLPGARAYRSKPAALLLLHARGWANVAEALDGLGLQRITPAARLPGDIVQMPSDDEFGALTIALTNGRVFGYHEQAEGAVVMQPAHFAAAWRVVIVEHIGLRSASARARA